MRKIFCTMYTRGGELPKNSTLMFMKKMQTFKMQLIKTDRQYLKRKYSDNHVVNYNGLFSTD